MIRIPSVRWFIVLYSAGYWLVSQGHAEVVVGNAQKVPVDPLLDVQGQMADEARVLLGRPHVQTRVQAVGKCRKKMLSRQPDIVDCHNAAIRPQAFAKVREQRPSLGVIKVVKQGRDDDEVKVGSVVGQSRGCISDHEAAAITVESLGILDAWAI